MPYDDVINTAISTNPVKRSSAVAGALKNGRYSTNLLDPTISLSGVPDVTAPDLSGIVVSLTNRFDDRTYYSA